MKKLFPRYKQGEILLIKSKLSKKDKDILDKFLIYCGGTAGERRLRNIETKMLQIRDVSEISYIDWNLDKLRSFLAILNKSELSKATKNDIKKALKRFLRETYDNWSKKFKGLKDIKGESDINEQRINANTLITEEELEQLIRSAENLRFKSLIMLMYESGARPDEILKLRWKDLNLDIGEVKLSSSKNQTVRVNPIKEAIIHLKRYKQEYPFPNVTPNDFVFPSPTNRRQQFSVSYFSGLFKKLSKVAIGRETFPYLIRHTRATQLQKVLPPKVYEKFMDHSIETATRYSHLDKDDVREVMLEKIYHIEELTPEEKDEIKLLKEKIEGLERNREKEIIEIKAKSLDYISERIKQMRGEIIKELKQ